MCVLEEKAEHGQRPHLQGDWFLHRNRVQLLRIDAESHQLLPQRQQLVFDPFTHHIFFNGGQCLSIEPVKSVETP